MRIQLIETAAHHLFVREVGEHYYKLVNVSTVFWTGVTAQLKRPHAKSMRTIS